VLADPYTDLAERLKLAIGYNEDAEVERMRRLRSNYYTFVADLDFKSCKVVTPSYRELPPELPTAPCSGRTRTLFILQTFCNEQHTYHWFVVGAALCESVLNDRWVTLPSGTEDQSFKITRKNQYEDALFKCEDERYELDMVIQNNTSTLKWLDSVKLHLDSLSPADRQKFQLRPTKKTPLNVLHLRSIARVYGDAATEVLLIRLLCWVAVLTNKHALACQFQMIELLKTSPAVVVPILTARLFQKDTEWRKVRLDMKRTWRDVCEKNFNKSLDHRSFYFKQGLFLHLGHNFYFSVFHSDFSCF
jgi:paired amphipathic helix protein Sin3a